MSLAVQAVLMQNVLKIFIALLGRPWSVNTPVEDDSDDSSDRYVCVCYNYYVL